jgi:hypothetical protein
LIADASTGFAKLPGAGEAPARVALRARLMIERLAVAADQIELDFVLRERCGHCFGVGQAEPPVEPRQLGG